MATVGSTKTNSDSEASDNESGLKPPVYFQRRNMVRERSEERRRSRSKDRRSRSKERRRSRSKERRRSRSKDRRRSRSKERSRRSRSRSRDDKKERKRERSRLVRKVLICCHSEISGVQKPKRKEAL